MLYLSKNVILCVRCVMRFCTFYIVSLAWKKKKMESVRKSEKEFVLRQSNNEKPWWDHGRNCLLYRTVLI